MTDQIELVFDVGGIFSGIETTEVLLTLLYESREQLEICSKEMRTRNEEERKRSWAKCTCGQCSQIVVALFQIVCVPAYDITEATSNVPLSRKAASARATVDTVWMVERGNGWLLISRSIKSTLEIVKHGVEIVEWYHDESGVKSWTEITESSIRSHGIKYSIARKSILPNVITLHYSDLNDQVHPSMPFLWY